MPETNWYRPLPRAIVRPDGKKVVTLLDAYNVILELPKKKQAEPLPQALALVLIEVAEGRGSIHMAQSAAATAVHGPRKDEQPKKQKLKIGKRLPR